MSTFSRLLSSTALVMLAATAASAGSAGTRPGFDTTRWALEDGTTAPSYAATEPTRTTVNLDAVVLACEATDRRHALQLQLYTVDEGPLRPTAAATSVRLEDEPTAEVAIDGQVFPVSLLFSDRFAVLADGERDGVAALSDRFLDALQAGRSMTLRFDLVAGDTPGRNDEAVVDLRSSGAQAAFAALRRCADSAADLRVGAASAVPPTH